MDAIARQVVVTGTDAAEVGARLVEQLAHPALKIAFVFADWRLEPAMIAATTQRGLQAPVVGGTTMGVIGRGLPRDGTSAVALGLYGDAFRVGIGVAAELPKAALTRSRDAVNRAVDALGTTPDALDSLRHVGITIVDGTCGHEESFCIGSAAAAPKIRFVGGCAAAEIASARRGQVWVNGEVMMDAGIVIVLETDVPFAVVTSSHTVATDLRTVVTAASGRVIDELDGRPAGARLRELIAQIGEELDAPRPWHSFARYIDGVPYVRSMTHLDGDRIHVASAVEPGHVLRIMRPGDLIGTTTRDLEAAKQRVGGDVSAFLAFSCVGRHWEASARGHARELAGVYDGYPTIGFQTFGEQSGMLLVNHTLTGLVLGAQPEQR